MAQVIPFKAVRPNNDIAAHFCSQSIDSYTKSELDHLLESTPHSFLQIIAPSLKKQNKLSSKQRYQSVHNIYNQFKDRGILIEDSQASFYIYEIQHHNQNFCGIIGGVSVEDYNKNILKKHENTLETREKIFKNYLKITRFNAEPVLVTYKQPKSLSEVIKNCKKEIPSLEFSTPDGEHHLLWKIDNENQIQSIADYFKSISALYIADGHHRSASSALLHQETKDPQTKKATAFFMAYLIPDHQLVIQEYNRAFRGLNGLTKKELLTKLEENFIITPQSHSQIPEPSQYRFIMYLKGQYYCLSLREKCIDPQNPLLELDAYILQEKILKPILGVKNPRKDKRLHYFNDNNSMSSIKSGVDSDHFSLGFKLKPVTVNQFKTISDAALMMPPKSTYIIPKLKSGLTIYQF